MTNIFVSLCATKYVVVWLCLEQVLTPLRTPKLLAVRYLHLVFTIKYFYLRQRLT